MSNLILFGDSMLGYFGTNLVKTLESRVADLHVHNCAIGGATTEDGLEKVKYIASLKPNIVLLSFGTNDIFQKTLPPSDFLNNLIKIINSFKGARVIIWLTPKANDVNDIDGTAKFNSDISEYNKLVQKYCLDKKIEFIDSFTDYKIEVGKKDLYHEDDGIHLTDEGYKPFIDLLSKLLNK
jgi:lysophospholipase L1-like esterase